jgi:hypothetical protein
MSGRQGEISRSVGWESVSVQFLIRNNWVACSHILQFCLLFSSKSLSVLWHNTVAILPSFVIELWLATSLHSCALGKPHRILPSWISFLDYCGNLFCYRLRTLFIAIVACFMPFQLSSRKRVQYLCTSAGCHQSLEWFVHKLYTRV